ncbi:Pyruvate decarboxylase [Cladobotryum mycophilum]|uniref:Pyruvate decarboxylase n=1 Tax=Cladobotryum mycophilum TaxID=491253 RepID=A0ABR0T0R8_9HYPO
MSEILVGEYLFRRLKEIGIQTIFGVPGDYELVLLDLIPASGLSWVGTPNELVGAYAADGYARLKGAAAVVTTFGPGELSALCGLGGAYCEFVPVLHIVGYPTTKAQGSGKILHHTLGDKSYDHYVRMSAELSCATAVLKESHNAVSEIDRVLNAMMYHSQPGYIGISEDVAFTKIPIGALETAPIARALPRGPQDDMAIAEIVARLEAAKSPVIIVDGGAARREWTPHVESLVQVLPIPHFVTILGKGAINEENPLFGGWYAGAGSWPRTIKAVEQADCILWLGNLPSDFNTGVFSEHVEPSAIVDFQRFHVKVGETQYNARINHASAQLHVLPKLTEAIKASPTLTTKDLTMKLEPRPAPMSMPSEITQDWFWERVSSFIKSGDLVVAETGTAQFGISATSLPSGSHSWTQAIWGSIGYAIAAAIGGSIAGKELGKYKRMVVFTGDGSLQLTVQAFSLLNRHGIVPIVFILNNKGYTVERFFRGWSAEYNDIPMWDYGSLFQAFSPLSGTKSFKVRTAAELDALLSDERFQTATTPQCVDMDLGVDDAPVWLKKVFESKKK